MTRRAGILVVLGMLGGCVASPPQPEVIDMTQSGRQYPGYPRGMGRLGDGPAQPGMTTAAMPRRNATWPQGAAAPNDNADAALQAMGPPRGRPQAGNAASVAALASSTPAAPLHENTPGRLGSEMNLASAQQPAEAETQTGHPVPLVNSRRLQLNYEIKDVGPSGLASVELWYTRNGGAWQKYAAAPQQPPFVIDVDADGLYGFTLLARNRAGQGKARPQPGEQPQVSVEVDLTKPTVNLESTQYDAQAKTLTILWQASDKNLSPEPIALCWARDAQGPWLPIISQLENTGRYVWKLPPGLPARFWVRAEASDLAGNVAMVQTPEAIALAPSPAPLPEMPEPVPVVTTVKEPELGPAPGPRLSNVQVLPEPAEPATKRQAPTLTLEQ